ncbi:hypothetical protein FKM82_028416, partial [Ascaphus truei]
MFSTPGSPLGSHCTCDFTVPPEMAFSCCSLFFAPIRRKQNYFNILRFLVLGDKKLSPFNLTHRFTHVFWLGDLNYRIQLPNTEAENIVQKIRLQQYPELLLSDQLSAERRDSQVFLRF